VLPDDMPEISVTASDGVIAVPQLLKMADLVSSASEAIRMIQQGAVKLDGERVNDRADTVEAGRVVVAQVGKRKFARITVI
jgi:tyrosyl-tRNA synthetase